MVYRRSMARTNIDLEDSALEAVMKRFHFTTKTEAVNYSLRAVAGKPMTREEILALQGTIDIDEVREAEVP